MLQSLNLNGVGQMLIDAFTVLLRKQQQTARLISLLCCHPCRVTPSTARAHTVML